MTHGIGADVTWTPSPQGARAFLLQLVEGRGGYQIAVLTAMALNG
jgi:hypothetical protein